jgi:hypothetical protein
MYSYSLIAIKLFMKRSWKDHSDLKKRFYWYYSLIGGSVAAVICGRYFRNRSDDLNPNIYDLRDRPHSSTRRASKTGWAVKTKTTIC